MAERWAKQIEALYGLDPDEFVAARNELAKEVRGGDRKAATAIRNLVKPTITAWAINQVALSKPKVVAGVVEATAGLQAAQDKALGGDRAALKAATDKRRKAVASVVDAAVAALSAAGRAAEAHREAIRNTVEAASLDSQAATLLVAGRLEHEMDAPATFGGLAASEPAEAPTSPQRARRERTSKQAAPADDAAELEREARRARAEAEDMAELAATARERAQDAAQYCRDARAAVDAAEAQLKDAKRDLERSMDAAKTTSMRAAEIERKAEDAKARAEELGAAAER